MQLISHAVYAVTVLATIVAAVPGPIVARGEKFLVFNGDKSVMVETEPSAETGNVLVALAEGDVDCKGSAFCERLGSSCDDAYRKVIPSNTYSTYLDTGTCSGTCGLFVSGNHCEVMGQDLMDAYNDIRNRGHCSHCGRKQIANGCLSRSQCQAAFPGLFQDIQRGVEYWKSRGRISRDDLSTVPFEDGMARAIISNGDLYVVATRAKGDDHRRKILGTLGSIHRALYASSNRTSHPTIEFIFSVEDRVDDVGAVSHPVWVLSRKASEESVILMPDFGYWSWAKSNIGPYGQVVQSIIATESNLKFADKEQKLVWRGKLSFAPKLRRALLDIARGKPWNDVKELDWSKKANFLSMEDHCRYMFIGHVEGRAYSASLKYRQACRSVVVAHKLQYIQHHHYLLVSSGPEQNYVEVERDFSDLPKRMDELLKSPDKAERIANNSVKTFRERYLTPAAEACYWRALWEGWAEISANVTRDVERPPVGRGLRESARPQYMGGGISNLKATLSGYKATVSITLGGATFRQTAVTSSVLEEYKQMIAETTSDPQDHLLNLDSRVQSLQWKGSLRGASNELEEIREEKASAEQCLNICAGVSEAIEAFEKNLSLGSDAHSAFRLEQRSSAQARIITKAMLTEFQVKLLTCRKEFEV
ncbi:hypothetical protein BBP40_010183 [Aspergillus hancockii]|nr:hypothetical protein BBP40_010183 [Aspergillus hancockii]